MTLNVPSGFHEAAIYGADGSTHAENIEDMQEYLDLLSAFDPEFDDDPKGFDLTLSQKEAIQKEIDACIQWHEKNGSLNKVVG